MQPRDVITSRCGLLFQLAMVDVVDISETSYEELDVCFIFSRLLLPSPTTEEVEFLSTPSRQNLRQLKPRSFVVNPDQGNKLFALLEPPSFLALPGPAKAQVLSLIYIGLRAGICSAVRLRLSCDGDQLVWRLLDLLKKLSASSDANDSQACLTSILGEVLGMVCSAGLGVDELKGLLCELRVPSAMTPQLVTALTTMTSPGGAPDGFPREGPSGDSMSNPRVFHRIFNFDGHGAGLVLPAVSWPFSQEYQLAAWVRVDPSAQSQSTATKDGEKSKPHLFTFASEVGIGVDYYLEVRASFNFTGMEYVKLCK